MHYLTGLSELTASMPKRQILRRDYLTEASSCKLDVAEIDSHVSNLPVSISHVFQI